jgi:hypothetical protein
MFEEDYESFAVWRAIKPNNFSDAVWTHITDVSGLWMPVSSGEEYLNDQPSEKFSDVVTLPMSYSGMILANDGLMNSIGRQMLVVGEPEEWPHHMPHIVVNLKSSQFLIGS